MVPLKKALQSSLGRKYLMGASGLALVGFLVTHLLGNLNLYLGAEAFNKYAYTLHSFGPLLVVAEFALLGLFLLHIVVALGIHMETIREARPSRYEHAQQSKEGPSYLGYASNNMLVTGLILLLFLVIHVLQMRFGFFAPEPTMTTVEGKEALDLYARVNGVFDYKIWVVFYMAVMAFLFAHLRHGFWSAFQSLGALNHRLETPMRVLAIVVGVLLAVGFLGLPAYVHLF